MNEIAADDFDQHALGFVVEKIVAQVDLAVVTFSDFLNGDELRLVDTSRRMGRTFRREDLARNDTIE